MSGNDPAPLKWLLLEHLTAQEKKRRHCHAGSELHTRKNTFQLHRFLFGLGFCKTGSHLVSIPGFACNCYADQAAFELMEIRLPLLPNVTLPRLIIIFKHGSVAGSFVRGYCSLAFCLSKGWAYPSTEMLKVSWNTK